MSPATTATSRTQKREAVSPARLPAFQSRRLYPATTSTTLSLLDLSAEGPSPPAGTFSHANASGRIAGHHRPRLLVPNARAPPSRVNATEENGQRGVVFPPPDK